MQETNYFELVTANRYISILSQNRKAMKQMIDNLRQLKKLDKEQQKLFDKAKKDLRATEASLNLWEEKERELITQFFGKEYVLPVIE